MTRLFSDRIVTESGEISGCVSWENGKIVSVLPGKNAADFGPDTADLTGKPVIPGLVELHTHGGGGHAFIGSSPEEIAAGCDFHLRHGTTTVLPTVTAGPFPKMAKAARDIRTAAMRGLTRACIPGVHMEGPYLSRKQAGAQCPSFITAPEPADYVPFLSEMEGFVRRWDFAPETDADGAFLRALRAHGVLAAAGHTDAGYADMVPAIEGGLSLITHLYSCTSTVTRKNGFRSAGVVETAFLEDRLAVEIIADGKHLPPELVRLVVKIKGREKVALISDSLAIAGTDVREGEMSGTEFIVEDGVCKLKDRSAFAGSVATADVLLRTLTAQCGISLADAVYMAATTPADLLGLPEKGRIAPGKDADIVVLRPDLTAETVFVAGSKVIP